MTVFVSKLEKPCSAFYDRRIKWARVGEHKIIFVDESRLYFTVKTDCGDELESFDGTIHIVTTDEDNSSPENFVQIR